VDGDVEDEDEDDDEVQPVEQENNTRVNGDALPAGAERRFSIEQINYRRKKLIGAMDDFQALLERLAQDPSQISSRLTAQTAFMINLMIYACTFDHKRQEGGSVKLMVIFPFHGSDRSCSFAFRVAQMLKVIWAGKNRIAQYITVDVRFQSLPDDMVAWILLSRWAIARSYLSGRNTRGLLAEQIGKLAKEVYTFTAALGPIVPEVETLAMRELDGRIGVQATQTEDLVLYSSSLWNLIPLPTERDLNSDGRRVQLWR